MSNHSSCAAGKILVIDDDDFSKKIISSVLSKEGYVIFTANNGKEGIDLAIEKEPNVIFMDVKMPGLDGYETTEQLKSYPKLKDVPVVFLTFSTSEEDGGRSFEKGGLIFMTKPVEGNRLKEIVQVVMLAVNVD